MPAVPLPLARAFLHPYYRLALHHRLPWSAQRALLNSVARFQPLPSGTRVDTLALGERRAERISVGSESRPDADGGAVLYLHGGGFTVGSVRTHRSLAAYLAREIRRPVYLLDYRLAPEHPFPAALDDAVAAFDALAETRHRGDSIALAGDSAGGCIALAAAQRLTARRSGGPAALVLLSPWANPGLSAPRSRDLVVSRRWGIACAAAYLGSGDPTDPGYAPALGRMVGLPPTYLFTSTRELLYDQCLNLAAGLQDAGVRLNFVESRDLWHAAQAQAALVKQAAESLRDVGAFLTRNWQTGEFSNSPTFSPRSPGE